ncbi:MAG: hypothetical protein HY719_08815 [Planctomycetes bacterium]|nr:hypothetical protein [Planctomycetota bacterium]
MARIRVEDRWLRKEYRFEVGNLDAMALDFEIGVLREGERFAPESLSILRPLAEKLTRRGDVAGGLRLDKRIVTLLPTEPGGWYNLACSHALAGDIASAFTALDQALRLGFKNWPLLAADKDLAPLRAANAERLNALIARHGVRLAEPAAGAATANGGGASPAPAHPPAKAASPSGAGGGALPSPASPSPVPGATHGVGGPAPQPPAATEPPGPADAGDAPTPGPADGPGAASAPGPSTGPGAG